MFHWSPSSLDFQVPPSAQFPIIIQSIWFPCFHWHQLLTPWVCLLCNLIVGIGGGWQPNIFGIPMFHWYSSSLDFQSFRSAALPIILPEKITSCFSWHQLPTSWVYLLCNPSVGIGGGWWSSIFNVPVFCLFPSSLDFRSLPSARFPIIIWSI